MIIYIFSLLRENLLILLFGRIQLIGSTRPKFVV